MLATPCPAPCSCFPGQSLEPAMAPSPRAAPVVANVCTRLSRLLGWRSRVSGEVGVCSSVGRRAPCTPVTATEPSSRSTTPSSMPGPEHLCLVLQPPTLPPPGRRKSLYTLSHPALLGTHPRTFPTPKGRKGQPEAASIAPLPPQSGGPRGRHAGKAPGLPGKVGPRRWKDRARGEEEPPGGEGPGWEGWPGTRARHPGVLLVLTCRCLPGNRSQSPSRWMTVAEKRQEP